MSRMRSTNVFEENSPQASEYERQSGLCYKLTRPGRHSGSEWPVFAIVDGNQQKAFENHLHWLTTLSFKDSLLYDVDMWMDTIEYADGARQTVLKKIFTVLRWSKITWCHGVAGKNNMWGLYEQEREWPRTWPVASVLSHAARVIITLPPRAKTDGDVWTWISAGQLGSGGVIEKRFSTHCTGTRRVGFGPEQKTIISESKGVTANFSGNHFGMHIAVGGEGRQAAVGRRVLSRANGDFGHIFFHYSAPTTSKIGSLMIGIEASGSKNRDQFGTGHGTGGEQAAAGIGLYWNTSRVVTGLDSVMGAPDQLPAKYDCMHIRKTSAWKLQNLKTRQWARTWLADPPPPLVNIPPRPILPAPRRRASSTEGIFMPGSPQKDPSPLMKALMEDPFA